MIRWLTPSYWMQRRADRDAALAIRMAYDQWLQFRATVHFADGTPLATVLQAFLPPMMENYYRNLPHLMRDPTNGVTAALAAVRASGDLDVDPDMLLAIHAELIRGMREREAARGR